MPEPFVWKLLIHMILGVEHMHYKNYIHRDLKTLNIFLTKDNIARVGDLGLAMKIDPNEENNGQANKNGQFDKEIIKEEKEEKEESQANDDKEDLQMIPSLNKQEE